MSNSGQHDIEADGGDESLPFDQGPGPPIPLYQYVETPSFTYMVPPASYFMPHNRKVFITNLPSQIREPELRQLFQRAGRIQRIFAFPESCSATVLFTAPVQAANAIALFNNFNWFGQLLGVSTTPFVTGTSLWIGNIPYSVTWRELKTFLRSQEVNGVQRVDIALSRTSRSRGYATVKFETAEQAADCAKRLNGINYKGRIITIRENREADIPNTDLETTAEAPTVSSAPQLSHGHNLFVGNIDYGARWFDLRDLFSNAGNAVRIDIARRSDGSSKGYGIAIMATERDAEAVKSAYNGYRFMGRVLVVRDDAH